MLTAEAHSLRSSDKGDILLVWVKKVLREEESIDRPASSYKPKRGMQLRKETKEQWLVNWYIDLTKAALFWTDERKEYGI